MALTLARSDSNESDCGAELAAVTELLRVASPHRTEKPTPSRLAAALAPRLPYAAPLLLEYASAAAACPRRLDAALIAAARLHLLDVARPKPAEAPAAVAWLCCVLAAGDAGLRAARAAHALLGAYEASEITELTSALTSTPEPWGARELLELGDALRGGGATADALARALLAATAGALLGEGSVEEAVKRWRTLDARAQYTALQMAGRAHEAKLALAMVEAAPRFRARGMDTLKVLVAASKLQVMFHNESKKAPRRVAGSTPLYH